MPPGDGSCGSPVIFASIALSEVIRFQPYHFPIADPLFFERTGSLRDMSIFRTWERFRPIPATLEFDSFRTRTERYALAYRGPFSAGKTCLTIRMDRHNHTRPQGPLFAFFISVECRDASTLIYSLGEKTLSEHNSPFLCNRDQKKWQTVCGLSPTSQ